MTSFTPPKLVGILARLVMKAPGQKLGRTAVMKLLYFLQELKSVPLGYDFRLYTYGPFDSDVLSDLATATVQNVVSESTVIYPNGYGYEITPGIHAPQATEDLDPGTAKAIDEVVAAFGSLGAAELELRSTILYVDREFEQQGSASTVGRIVERVRQIKPHFAESVILDQVTDFERQGWLRSV